jgi:hypothetical protein
MPDTVVREIIYEAVSAKPIVVQLSGMSWLSVVGVIAAAITSLATGLYLLATYRLFVETRKSNALTRTMTTKLLSDALTPFLEISSIRQGLSLSSQFNRTLVIRAVEVEDDDGAELRVNGRSSVKREDVVLHGTIVVEFENVSVNSAQAHGTLKILSASVPFKAIIEPHRAAQIEIEIAEGALGADAIRSLLAGTVVVDLDFSYHGPGVSAKEEAKMTFLAVMQEHAGAITTLDAPITMIRTRTYLEVVGGDS